MKYIVRFIAVLPATAVLLMALVSLIISFEYHLLIIPTIFQFIAGVILLDDYEETVIKFKNLLNKIANEKA